MAAMTVQVDTTWQFDDAPPEAPLTASVPIRNPTPFYYMFCLNTPKRKGGVRAIEPTHGFFGIVPPNGLVRVQVLIAPGTTKVPGLSAILNIKRWQEPDPPSRPCNHQDEFDALPFRMEPYKLVWPVMSDLILFDNFDGTLRGRVVLLGDTVGKQKYLAHLSGSAHLNFQPGGNLVALEPRQLVVQSVTVPTQLASSMSSEFSVWKVPVDNFWSNRVTQWGETVSKRPGFCINALARLVVDPAEPAEHTSAALPDARATQPIRSGQGEGAVEAAPVDSHENETPLGQEHHSEQKVEQIRREQQEALDARDVAESVLQQALQEQLMLQESCDALEQQLRLQRGSFEQHLQQAEAVRVALEQQLRQARMELQRAEAERNASATQLLAERRRREMAEQQVATLRAQQHSPSLFGDARATSVLTLQDLQVVRCIAHGSNGMVFEVEWRFCPASPPKRYAMKMCFNLGITGTGQVRDRFAVEYQELSLLPPHPNINRFLTAFVDEVSDDVLVHLQERAPAVAEEAVRRSRVTRALRRCKCQFFLLELQDRTLKAQLREWPEGRRVTPFAVSVLRDLARASLHCLQHGVLHLDVKTDNVLLEADLASLAGCRALLCDFGSARRFDAAARSTLRLEAHPSLWHGHALWGNQSHVCPELLNARGNQTDLDFSGQPVFELGVLGFEILMDEHPLGEYPLDHGPTGRVVFDADAELRLRCEPILEEGHASRDLFELLRRMVAFDPARRPLLAEVLEHLELMLARFNGTAVEEQVEA